MHFSSVNTSRQIPCPPLRPWNEWHPRSIILHSPATVFWHCELELWRWIYITPTTSYLRGTLENCAGKELATCALTVIDGFECSSFSSLFNGFRCFDRLFPCSDPLILESCLCLYDLRITLLSFFKMIFFKMIIYDYRFQMNVGSWIENDESFQKTCFLMLLFKRNNS